MIDKTLEEKLGFDILRSKLSELCISAMGRNKLAEMEFSSNYDVVLEKLRSVDEMTRLLSSGGSIPIDFADDLNSVIVKLKAEGGYATAEGLLKLKKTMSEIRQVKSLFSDGALYPTLKSRFDNICDTSEPEKSIELVIDKFGQIKDSASPKLAEIRSGIRKLENNMSALVRRVITRGISEGYLEKDTTATMRDGRLVIPVSSANKRRISGIVHDESATGRTTFIEPAEAVEAANRLRELQMEEHREEIIILMALATELRPYADDFLLNLDYAGDFDFIRAKALLAMELNAEMPTLEKGRLIDWYGAKHPVLLMTLKPQNREVVPLNLSLDYNKRILIISGPNAGGKSVALKTVGIVQYMAQCGLLPTLYSNSHMGIFRTIMVDIGDEQSLENDLSTYSSHLRNMKRFLLKADKRTLFLADEMGSGTEPQMGGALAQAILLELAKTGAFGIVTTHYHNLKTLADSHPEFVNGAMLYDRQHLQPLFSLSLGTPGSSFALEIARKSGLPLSVIDQAKDLVGSEYVNLDKYLLDITRDKRYWADKRLRIRQLEKRNEELTEQLEKRVAELSSMRREIIGEARKEARQILEGTNALIENSIHEIRKVQAEKERTKEVRKSIEDYKEELEKEKIAENEKLKELKKSQKGKNKHKEKTPKTETLSPIFNVGDYARMSKDGLVGKILSISGDNAEVAFGGIKTRIKLEKLIPASAPKAKESSPLGRTTNIFTQSSHLSFSTELDVRGMRVDEALQAVTYFIDDAIRYSQSRVRILHGTGTGALRVAIRQLLNSTPGVASSRDEDVRFGGAGITVVNLE